MHIRSLRSALLPAAVIAFLLAAASASAQSDAPPPAISGVATAPGGNLLVSPPFPGPGMVYDVAPDGTLARSWPVPEGSLLEVADADPDGRPVCLETRAGKIWILTEKGAADWLLLGNVKGADPRSLAPLVRAGARGEVVVPAADGSAIYRVTLAGVATKVALAGTHSGLTDFDVADDGRIAILDATTATLRMYGPDGSSLWDIPIAAPGAAPNAFYAMARFVPGSDEVWILDLPPAGAPVIPGKSAAGLQRFDATGKRALRLDRYADGTIFEPAAGIAPAKDGVWIADLAGQARKIDRAGALKIRFDAAPPPPGVSWDEKRRLQQVAKTPDKVSLPDAVAALGVVRNPDDAEAMLDRLIANAKEAEPLLVAATSRQSISPVALATFYDKTQPAMHDALAAAFKNPAPQVRSAALLVLRDPKQAGFDAEALAAAKDTAPEVRAGALDVLSRQRWKPSMAEVFLVRLDDPERQVGILAAQRLAARLPETIDALVARVQDPKVSVQARDLAARAITLQVPEGDQIPALPPDRRGSIRRLAMSNSLLPRRVGILALVIHGDPKGAELFPSIWTGLDSDQRHLALSSWSPAFGDAGATGLISILGREKDPAMRALLLRALHRNGGVTARNMLVKLATTAGGNERDRVVSIDLAKRRLSDDQIVALANELPKPGSDLRRQIMRVAAERGVAAAAPKISQLAGDAKDGPDAFVALYRLGSKAGVEAAVARATAGQASEVEMSYLASVGGLPAAAQPAFEAMAKASGDRSLLASEALARSGNAAGLGVIVDHVKSDRYGATARDGALPGSLAALGDAGRKAAVVLLADPNAATREDAALALALLGGDACKDLAAFKTNGISVPAAFFAFAACGDAKAAQDAYRRASEDIRPGDAVSQTAAPDAFASLLAQTLRQPDFRAKADPVLSAVAGLPRPVVTAVATALSTELDPAVAGAAMKYVFGSLQPQR